MHVVGTTDAVMLLSQVIDAEAALKARMAKVSELERKAAAAPEPVRALQFLKGPGLWGTVARLL